MKTKCDATKAIAIMLAGLILLSSCVSTTMIQSFPSEADLYLNGELAGTTPYTHSDTKIVGTTTTVRLEKEGYQPYEAIMARNEKAAIGAIFAGMFLLFPFLWTMKYKPSRTYQLQPISETPGTDNIIEPQMSQTKAERLREMKKLLDDGIITKEEYEKEKKKILDEK